MNVVEAILAGLTVIIPTDTVYGLAATPDRAEPVERVYRLKGRDPEQPSALLTASIEVLFARLPELDDRARLIARALLPGPYTLVLPNPAGRFPWLCGVEPHAIGVRVPVLPEPSARVLTQVGAIVATSANAPGGPDPARLEDVPAELRAGAAAVLDAGELPGMPSTVLDFTGPAPRIAREGSASGAEAIDVVSSALA